MSLQQEVTTFSETVCQMVPFSLKLEVKDANRNSIGCFPKIYVTSHQSISISLAFEALVPPLFSIQRDPNGGSWLPPRGIFSEDATAASAHTYWTTQTGPCFKVSSMDHCLIFLSIKCCTLALGSLQDFAPETVKTLEASVPGEKVLRSFPCSVVWSPHLHFGIAFSCKQDDLQTTGFARRLTSGSAIVVIAMSPWSRFRFSIFYKSLFHIWAIEDNISLDWEGQDSCKNSPVEGLRKLLEENDIFHKEI